MRTWIWQGPAVSMFTAMAVCHAWIFGGGDLAAGMKHRRGPYGLCLRGLRRGRSADAPQASLVGGRRAAFDNLGWTEVIHCIDPENTGSQRVAERLDSRHRRRVT